MDLPPGAELRGDHPVTDSATADPRLARIQRFPIKSLDLESLDTATVVADGALAGDRRWAILDRPPGEPYDPTSADVRGAGDFVNGKKTAGVHRLRSRFVPAGHARPPADSPSPNDDRSPDDSGPAVELRRQGETSTGNGDGAGWCTFDLWDGATDHEQAVIHEPLNDWLSDFFDRPVSVRRTDAGQHDDRKRHGPTVVSTATLREVAAWFDFGVESARRRFRANLEMEGVPPFWEDRLFGDRDEIVAFRVGAATLHGVHPCARCVVPGRDPDTGAETPGFRRTFIERRRATMPPWTASDRFDHDFRLMVNTEVPEESVGEEVAVGDNVAITASRS